MLRKLVVFLIVASLGMTVWAQEKPKEKVAGPVVTKGPKSPGGVRGAIHPDLSPDGKEVVFSLYGDLWVVPVRGGNARRITLHSANDVRPKWSPDGRFIAFTSDRQGNFDIYITLAQGGTPRRVTYHSRTDSINDWTPDGQHLLFHSTREGRSDLFRIPVNGGLPIRLTTEGGRGGVVSGSDVYYTQGANDRLQRGYQGTANWDLFRIPMTGGNVEALTNFMGNDMTPAVHPNGKVLFFLREVDGRYQIFRMDLETRKASRLVNVGSEDVRALSLSGNGKTLIFEYDFCLWKVGVDGKGLAQIPIQIVSDLKGEDVETRTLTEGLESFDLSPSGKTVVFELRGDLWRMMASGGPAVRLTSGSARDEWPRFSPDGRWIAFQSDRTGNHDLFIMPVRGGEPTRVTNHPKDDFYHRWLPDGKSLVFTSERSGNREIWIQNLKSGEARQLTRHSAADDDAVVSPDGKRIAFDSGRTGKQEIWVMGVDGSNPTQLTQHGHFSQVPAWSPDGKRLAYEVIRERSSSVWVLDLATKATLQITGDGSQAQFSPDGQWLYVLSSRGRESKRLYRLPAPQKILGGEEVPVMANSQVDLAQERRQVFEEAWMALKNGFYDPKFHGIDWDAMKAKYLPLATSARTNQELVTLLHRMAGELKASHVGAWGPSRIPNRVSTGYLGAEIVASSTGSGLRIERVEPNGPADQVWLRAGDLIFAIAGRPVNSRVNPSQLLQGTVGKEVLLVVAPKDSPEVKRTIKIKPISRGGYAQLRYTNWLKKNVALVRSGGKGEIAYIHLTAMNAANLAMFERYLAGSARKKKALIIDVRNNGGGNIHQQLLDILGRRPFAYVVPRGGKKTYQPGLTWNKPVCVLINERSFSDAEVFPYCFKHMKLGVVIGVPTAGGVIGTRNIVLSNGTTFRIPRTGYFGLNGINLEGLGVKPDRYVPLTLEDKKAGRDPQLQAGIAHLRQVLYPKKTSADSGVTTKSSPEKKGKANPLPKRSRKSGAQAPKNSEKKAPSRPKGKGKKGKVLSR